MFLNALAVGIDELVPPSGRVVLAVSGGPDSLALLLGWSRLAGDRGDEIHVAHFDHRLREDSALDVEFVRAISDELDLEFHTQAARESLADRPGSSLEEAARNCRYEFLTRVARSAGAAHVATAHSADDQVETVLHAILRGTGIHGLAGMPSHRSLGEGIELVRPMLRITRRAVLEFLEVEGRPIRHDQTNYDLERTRNRIRHELLPMLRERYNPRVDAAVLRLAGLARASSTALLELADGLLGRSLIHADSGELRLALEPLRRADRHIAAEAIRLLLDRQGWPRRRFGFAELESIVEMIHEYSPRALDLPNAIRAECSNDSRASLLLRRGLHRSSHEG